MGSLINKNARKANKTKLLSNLVIRDESPGGTFSVPCWVLTPFDSHIPPVNRPQEVRRFYLICMNRKNEKEACLPICKNQFEDPIIALIFSVQIFS